MQILISEHFALEEAQFVTLQPCTQTKLHGVTYPPRCLPPPSPIIHLSSRENIYLRGFL